MDRSVAQYVLNCDPMLDLYQSGAISLIDLKNIGAIAPSNEIEEILINKATSRISRASHSLRSLSKASESLIHRMRSLVWELERQLHIANVPDIHPSLCAPLTTANTGFIAPAVFYGDIPTLTQSIRFVTHPSAWASSNNNLWDAIACSTSICMKPLLALVLSLIIPTEARLSYIMLRHTAYASSTVDTLGTMVSHIIASMMVHPLGSRERIIKTMRLVDPSIEPLSLYVLRMYGKRKDRSAAHRAMERQQIEGSLTELFEQHGDDILFSTSQQIWWNWLLDMDEGQLVSFYVKYLQDGFQ